MKTRVVVVLGLLFVLLVACGGVPAPTHTPADAVAAFKSAGLEAENTRDMGPDDYGLAPFIGEGVRFFIPSLCEDCGGRIYALDNQDDLEKMKTFYVTMGEESAILFSWVFTKDNILVQINGDLDEETARQYETALNNLGE